GHIEHSVLSPGVYVEEGAVVRDSIIFDDCRIESGAIIERSIIDKGVLVGKNAYVGYGDDWSPNHERPDIVNCGITIVGKREKVPYRLTIGITPVLAEQLADADVLRNLDEYLDDRRARASSDVSRFEREGEPARAAVAAFYRDRFDSLSEQFRDRFGRDLIGA